MIHGSLNLAISFPGAALYIFNGTYDKYQCNTCVAPNLSPCPSPNFIELLLFATLISAGSWKYLYSINFIGLYSHNFIGRYFKSDNKCQLL